MHQIAGAPVDARLRAPQRSWFVLGRRPGSSSTADGSAEPSRPALSRARQTSTRSGRSLAGRSPMTWSPASRYRASTLRRPHDRPTTSAPRCRLRQLQERRSPTSTGGPAEAMTRSPLVRVERGRHRAAGPAAAVLRPRTICSESGSRVLAGSRRRARAPSASRRRMYPAYEPRPWPHLVADGEFVSGGSDRNERDGDSRAWYAGSWAGGVRQRAVEQQHRKPLNIDATRSPMKLNQTGV